MHAHAPILALALAVCCGCSTVVVRETPGNIAAVEALLDEVRGTEIRMVEGAWKDEAFSAECVLKGDGERLTAVLLSPHMRLATLALERPHTMRWERVPQIPSALDPEYVLLDLALVRLPTDALTKVLGGDCRVDETPDGKRRMVVKDGRLDSVRQILPNGGIYFRNVRHGYEFTITALPQ